MDSDEKRKSIHDAISEAFEDDSLVISGWVLVFEHFDEDGDRDLAIMSSDASGNHQLPEWSGNGWLRFAAEELDWELAQMEEVTEDDDED